jgi:hypothetical protein
VIKSELRAIVKIVVSGRLMRRENEVSVVVVVVSVCWMIMSERKEKKRSLIPANTYLPDILEGWMFKHSQASSSHPW